MPRQYTPRSERTCETCGKSFSVKASVATKGKGRFCSRSCADMGQRLRVGRVCEQCGKSFLVKPNKVKEGKARFCSRACMSASRRKQVSCKCQTCGVEFTVHQDRYERGNVRFCSRTCTDKAHAVKRGSDTPNWRGGSAAPTCEQCGASFTVKKSRVANGRGRFCSRACKGRWQSANAVGEQAYNWQGGIHSDERWTPEHRAWRDAVFSRDNYTCQKCGERGGNLNAHHIKHWASYPDLRFDVSNGQTLCKPCHLRLHAANTPSPETLAILAAGRQMRLQRLSGKAS